MFAQRRGLLVPVCWALLFYTSDAFRGAPNKTWMGQDDVSQPEFACGGESAVLEWLKEGYAILEKKESGRVYLGCAGAGNRHAKQKASCRPDECHLSNHGWCWVPNHCGYSTECKELELEPGETPLNCDKIRLPTAARALYWSFRTSKKRAGWTGNSSEEIASPRDRDEIAQVMRSESPPQPVGEGWSFLLSHKPPQGDIFSLRGNWAGLDVPFDHTTHVARVRTGTTFGSLKALLAPHKRALFDRVQYDQISFGGALHTAAHGWSTSKSMIESVTSVEGIERHSGDTIIAHRGSAEFWRVVFGDDVVIVSADIETIPNDRICTEQIYEAYADSEPTLDSQVGSGTLERLEKRSGGPLFDHPFAMLFVGQHGALHKRASYFNEADTCWSEASRMPPTKTGKQIRLMRHLMGDFYGSIAGMPLMEQFAEINTVGTAHTMVETMGYVSQLGVKHTRDMNMELLIDFWPNLEAAVLSLERFHKTWGGRTEFRRRIRGKSVVTWLDLHMPHHKEKDAETGVPVGIVAYLQLVKAKLGATSCAAHTGKYVPSSFAPLTLVPLSQFWQDATAKAAMDP